MSVCPNCGKHLERLKVRGRYEADIVLSRCFDCLGIWADGFAVRNISFDTALDIEYDVNSEEIPRKRREGEMECLNCGKELSEQSGRGLPDGLRFDYCIPCDSYWFAWGALILYKEHLEKKIEEFRKKSRQESAEEHRKSMQRHEKFMFIASLHSGG
jgi:Zn-finger nucleic acid-binding protein